LTPLYVALGVAVVCLVILILECVLYISNQRY